MSTARVIVIGSGAAGLQAAIASCGTATTTIVTDGPLGRSNSVMAQGGMHVPHDSDDSRRSMMADIVRSARTDVDTRRVEQLVERAHPTTVQLEAWGLELRRDANGEWIRRAAGGLTEPRIVGVVDGLGPALVRTLRERIEALPIEVVSHSRVLELDPDRLSVTIRSADGSIQTLTGSSIVVCTGGTTYWKAVNEGEFSTNPSNANHEVTTLLRDIGLPRIGEDRFQFQPYGMMDIDRRPVRCIPETLATMGRLLDRHGTLIADSRSDRLETTAAITAAIEQGRGVEGRLATGVRLDLSSVPASAFHGEFRRLRELLSRAGITLDRITVRPALHYQLGGFDVLPDGSTELAGVFLAGEITGGIHGENRLMGTGIMDSLVHGRIAGLSAGSEA